jgi:hypothetical protein
VPQWRTPIFTDGDVYDATNNPLGNLLPNGAMTGTGGTATTCTGSIPSFTTLTITGGGATCVGSVITLGDGRSALQVVISGSSTGTSNEVYIVQSVATPSNVNVGDVLEGTAWVTMNGPYTNMVGTDVYVIDTEGGTNYAYDSGVAAFTDPWASTGFVDGQQTLLVTSRRIVVGTVTAISFEVRMAILNGSVSPSATIVISSMALKKVLN